MFLCFVGISGIYSQPFRLKADIWYDSEQQLTNQLQENALNMSALQKTTIISDDSVVLLNFHLTQSFNEETTPFHAGFDIGKSSRLTVIVVFHSEEKPAEHGIWSVRRGGKQITGLTDRRLLRSKGEYVYPVKKRGIPLINTSMQAFSKIRGKADGNYFILGEATLPDNSLSSFSGEIAECLVFGRFLQKNEALKIETYLALKYGITLIASDYLSSSDMVLWNYEENKDYSYGIAGIGKDSISGLDQKQGNSSEEAGLLTISTGNYAPLNKDNKFVLPEDDYLVWGHNDSALTYNNQSCGEAYPLLERKWLLQATYTDTAVRFPTRVRLRLPEEYKNTSGLSYLIIDRSGTGNFSSGDVEYIPQMQTDEDGYVYFNNVMWDTDGSGKDIFSFSFGPVLESVVTNSCPKIFNGTLTLNICGGSPPFTYILANANQQFTDQGGRDYIFENLLAGQYILFVTDSNNQTIVNTVEIMEFPAIESLFPPDYIIGEDMNTFDEESYFGKFAMSYTWTKDGKLFSEEGAINVSLPGCYKLTVTDTNGCIYTFNVLAEEPIRSKNHKLGFEENRSKLSGQGIIAPYYKVYPNPTTGYYKVEADLPEETPIFVRVYTANGSLLEEWKDKGKKYYSFDSYLPVTGTYLLEVETSFEIKDFKIVVVK